MSPLVGLRGDIQRKLQGLPWLVADVGSAVEALEYLNSACVDLILLDPQLPDLLPNEFRALVANGFPEVQLLTLDTDGGRVALGSSSPTPIVKQLANALQTPAAQSSLPDLGTRLRMRREGPPGLRGVIGESAAMKRVYELTHMVARRDTTVLITGESGTGKDGIAQAVHLMSPRSKQPLVTINCAAIPEALLEAELFGYVKGAFTGASQSRVGRIHAAHGGTLFLDEIGDMPLALQSKLLRFLEQGEVQRLGGNDNLRVDVRVIAATNADLQSRVKQKLFREDLFYRLAVFPIELPPLRLREGDVALLSAGFLQKFCPQARISPAAAHRLQTHSWPGNVRELRNVIERCSILIDEGAEIEPSHIVF